MKEPSVFMAERYDDRSLITSILASFYIVDYGFITKVNGDGTINVTHAKIPKTTEGESLQAVKTEGIEVLTISGKGYSIKLDYEKGDQVLLLGLKDFVPKAAETTQATETKNYIHYSRETLKALPLCAFNDKAKVIVETKNGTLKVDAQQKIELNGNSKQFVTWAELNQALTQYSAQLSTALLAATYINTAGTPTVLAWTGGTPPTGIDISGAKTTTVVTGG